MLDFETRKGQRNLEEKEKIEATRLVKETVPKALGSEISFEKLFLLYTQNHEDIDLKEADLIEEILDTLKEQLGPDAETDESNLIFILVLIYETFDSDSPAPMSPANDSEVEKITI